MSAKIEENLHPTENVKKICQKIEEMGGTTKVKIQEKLRQKSVVEKEKFVEKTLEEFKKKEEKVVENFRIKVKEDKRKTSSKNENSKNEVEVKKSANIFKNWIEKAQDFDKSKKRSVFGDKSGAKRRRDKKTGEDRPSPSKVLKTDQKWTKKINFDVKSDYHSTQMYQLAAHKPVCQYKCTGVTK